MNVLFLTETWFLMVMALTPQFYGVFPSIICHLENLFDLLTYIDRWFEIVTLAKNVVVYQGNSGYSRGAQMCFNGRLPFSLTYKFTFMGLHRNI